MIQYTSISEFFHRTARTFEEEFGRQTLENDAAGPKPHNVSRLWKSCIDFASSPRLEDLSDQSRHDIAFSVLLARAFENLRSRGRLHQDFMDQLWNDRPSFLHRAYEAEVAAYFIDRGYEDTSLDEPDVVIKFGAEMHFLACKKLEPGRSKSKYLKKLKEHLKKAIDQIGRHGSGSVMIEVDSRSCAIDEMETLVNNCLGCKETPSVVQYVFLTWWDPSFTTADLPNRHCRAYALRRQVRTISCHNGPHHSNSPIFEGQTIEWIDTPPTCEVLVSSVARSDDWIKTVISNRFEPDAFFGWGEIEHRPTALPDDGDGSDQG